MPRILKTIDLDLSDIPRNKIRKAKRDVLDFLENEIQRNVSKGKTPVQGEANFKRLNSKYAKGEKQGNSIANLQLEGDLMQALEFNMKSGSKISIGYSSGNPEVDKADGHNQFSADAKKQTWGSGKNKRKKLPKRRYIPDSKQEFKKGIMIGVDQILDDLREKPEVQRDAEIIITDTRTNEETTGVETTRDLFDSDNIVDMLRREYLRGVNDL